ncbi:hypothetical protein C8F01DRAFT_1174443 [Mycena amicta]|nr:hypothetical protein C8F01DRAFT_1174443 [Mycena amicta]
MPQSPTTPSLALTALSMPTMLARANLVPFASLLNTRRPHPHVLCPLRLPTDHAPIFSISQLVFSLLPSIIRVRPFHVPFISISSMYTHPLYAAMIYPSPWHSCYPRSILD